MYIINEYVQVQFRAMVTLAIEDVLNLSRIMEDICKSLYMVESDSIPENSIILVLPPTDRRDSRRGSARKCAVGCALVPSRLSGPPHCACALRLETVSAEVDLLNLGPCFNPRFLNNCCVLDKKQSDIVRRISH